MRPFEVGQMGALWCGICGHTSKSPSMTQERSELRAAALGLLRPKWARPAADDAE